MRKKSPGPVERKKMAQKTDSIVKRNFTKDSSLFRKMVGGNNRISDSYKNEMISKSDSIVRTFDSSPRPRHVNDVVTNINNKRLKKVQATEAYRSLSKNPAISGTGIGKTVKHYEQKIESGRTPMDYQIPTVKEIDKILNFGKKASNETDINKAITKNPFSALGAYREMNRVRNNYPSMDSIAKKQEKRIK